MLRYLSCINTNPTQMTETLQHNPDSHDISLSTLSSPIPKIAVETVRYRAQKIVAS
jgi:hypothetical protein